MRGIETITGCRTKEGWAEKRLKKRLERAGKILLASDMDVKSKNIFLMYKQIGSIEKIIFTGIC